MKKWMKFLPAAVALFLSLPVCGQFTLTPRGFVNTWDKGVGYYVIDCPGRGQEELFRAVSYYLEVQLAGPHTMFHAVEPESFSVNAFVLDAVADGKGALRSVYDLEFRMTFDIRDGRVCVWAPEVKSMQYVRSVGTEAQAEIAGEPGLTIRVGHTPGNMQFVRLFVSPEYMVLGAPLYDISGYSIYNKRGKLKRKVAKESLENYFNNLTVALERYLCTDGGR